MEKSTAAPAALRLADALNNLEATGYSSDTVQLTDWSWQQAEAAAEALRSQHALIGELVDALEHVLDAIGALSRPHEMIGHGMGQEQIDSVFSILSKAKEMA